MGANATAAIPAGDLRQVECCIQILGLNAVSAPDGDDAALLQLRVTAGGVVLPVQAQAGARRNGFNGIHDGRLKVAVTQVAEKGKANEELQRLLAKLLGLSRSSVQLVSGETSPRKEFCIAGIAVDELRHRLAVQLAK